MAKMHIPVKNRDGKPLGQAVVCDEYGGSLTIYFAGDLAEEIIQMGARSFIESLVLDMNAIPATPREPTKS